MEDAYEYMGETWAQEARTEDDHEPPWSSHPASCGCPYCEGDGPDEKED